MKDVLLKIAESCYDEETTIDDEGNITGGRLTFNKDKFITEIADMVKAFVEWLMEEDYNPGLNMQRIDIIIKRHGYYPVKSEDIFNHWYNEIREK